MLTKVQKWGNSQQVKAIDFRARRARFLAQLPGPVLNEVLSILDACVY